MRRSRLWLCAALAAAPLFFQAPPASAAVAPVVHGFIEGRQSGTAEERPTITIVGSLLTKFTSFQLQFPDGTDAGAVTLVVKSKFMVIVALPATIVPGDYKLLLGTGKVSAPVWTEHPISVTLGAPKPGTVTLASLATPLQSDLGDADTLGGHAASFFQDASNLLAGTLSLTRFSAFDDLSAEAKIGTAAGTVAAGDHLHDTRYYTQTQLNAAGTINTAGNPVDWTKLKGVPAAFADGVDDGQVYTAGTAISIVSNVVSVVFGGTGGDFGAATSTARSDHLHDGRYFTETEINAAGTINTAANPLEWTKLKSVPAGFADGTDADSGGDITDVLAGTGLTGGGSTGSVTLSATYGGTGGDFGSATTLTRSDHIHDGRYFTETEVNVAGTINTASNPLEWTKLKNVPAGFADGVDGDTIYAAGAGLTLTGTTFAANFLATGGNNGTTSNPARSDHNHTSLTGALAVTNGLSVTGSVAGNLTSSVNTNTGAAVSGVYGQASSGAGTQYGVWGVSNGGSGRGVYGQGYYGLYGLGGTYGAYANGTAYGLYGQGGTTGTYGSGTSYGLYGLGGTYGVYASGSVYGVFGNDSSGSNYGVYGNSSNIGVYGNGSTGVYGSGSSRGVEGNSSSWAVYGNSSFLGVYGSASSGTYGVFAGGGTYGLYGSGSSYGVYCAGNFAASGTKSFVQKHPTDSSKAIVYVCLEGGESGTYCRGSGRLVNGEARIDLPEHFPLVTSPDGITAQVTPTSECRGLYVVQKTNRFLVVRELNGGTGGATFDWTVNGVRAGHENHEAISSDPVLVRALNNEGGTPEAVAGREPAPAAAAPRVAEPAPLPDPGPAPVR